jgi:hypothetical protein
METEIDHVSLKDEVSQAQVWLGQPSPFDGVLPRQQNKRFNYNDIRELRLKPLVHLARDLIKSPVLLSNWSVEEKEGSTPDMAEFIQETVVKKRVDILEPGLSGIIDYGFQAFEKVFEYRDNFVWLKKLKPLIPDNINLLVDPKTGKLVGLRQTNQGGTSKDMYTTLPIEKILVLNANVEGTNWYGESLLLSVMEAQNAWDQVEVLSNKYFAKFSGSRYVVHYPVGTSSINGVSTDNFEIAKACLQTLEGNRGIAVPRQLQRNADSLTDNTDAWAVEMLSDGSNSVTMFLERQKYLDGKIVEAMGLPAKAVVEGTFGSRALAETHVDSAVTIMQNNHQRIVNQVNKHVVNHLLRLNFGVEDTVFVVPSPIADLTIKYLEQVYTQLLTLNQSEQSQIDLGAIRDKIGIPTRRNNDNVEQNFRTILNDILNTGI